VYVAKKRRDPDGVIAMLTGISERGVVLVNSTGATGVETSYTLSSPSPSTVKSLLCALSITDKSPPAI
jgi:hypothetical protein